MSKICEKLGCRLPFIAAPMLGVGSMPLAIAAAECGAVGSMPCSGMSAEALDSLLTAHADALAAHTINFNFFCHRMPRDHDDHHVRRDWIEALRPYYAKEGVADPAAAVARELPKASRPFSAEVLRVLLRHRVRLVSFHFGLPDEEEELWAAVRASGMTTMCSATTVAEALYLQRRGVDVVIVQGWEAGGHRGCFLPGSEAAQQGTFALLPQVRRALGPDALLVAAGGVVDAATRRAAEALGADGVQAGTSLLLCTECGTKPVHARALEEGRAAHAAAQVCNTLSGRPARGLVNAVMAGVGLMRSDAPSFPYGAAYLAPLRAVAEPDNRGDYSALWAGQNLTGVERCSVQEKLARFFPST